MHNNGDSTASELLAKLGFIGAGVICWHGATSLWDSGTPVAYNLSLVLMLMSYLMGFAMFGLAATRDVPRWTQGLIPLALFFAAVCHVQYHRVALLEQGTLTTDLRLYMDYGARLLRQGENPYAHDLVEAFRLNRAPFNFCTPLINGDLTGRMAYPALSVLLFVPIQWLGIPTEWVYPLVLLLTFALLFIWSPAMIRPVILIPFFLDHRFILYTAGGVSDCVWALLLVLMIKVWHRPWLRAVGFGLACAFKHQPWILAPFLLIRLWRDSECREGARWRELGVFIGISVATFLLVNAPFISWDPVAWAKGVFEPVLAPMIVFGQGLSSLTMLGIVVVPRWVYSLFLLGVLCFSLFLYWRHFTRLRPLIWILPGLVLWVSNRSLTSYWYFYLIPFVFDLFRDLFQERSHDSLHQAGQGEDLRACSGPRRAWVATVVGALVLFVLISSTMVWWGYRASTLEIQVQSPMTANGNDSNQLKVLVKNLSHDAIRPRFAIQSGALQPFFWKIDTGPQRLLAGQNALYTISTDVPFASFDIRRGARVTVTDADSYAFRSTFKIEPEPQYVYPDVIPNGRFHYWEAQESKPTFWGIVAHPAGAGQITFIHPSGKGAPDTGLTFRLQRSTDDQRSWVLLDTYIVFPHHPIEIWVNPPMEANRLPDLNVVYGINLTIDDQHIWVLFGDRAAQGKIGSNTRYWVTPTPRNRWSKQTIDLRRVVADLGIQLTAVRKRMPRFHHLDFAMIPTNFQLLLSAKAGANPVVAQFGPVISKGLAPDVEALFQSTRQSPETLSMWEGGYNFAMRNYAQASTAFAAAARAMPKSSSPRLLQGEAEFWQGNWQAAIVAYQLAIAINPQDPLAYKGLGWSHFNLRQFNEALLAWGKALSLFEEKNRSEDGHHRADIFKGMGMALIHLGRCGQAELNFRKMRAIDATQEIPTAELNACILRRLEQESP